MFAMPALTKLFVVRCKRCDRSVPAGMKEFPFKSVSVDCCLCGEKRQYLPSEITHAKADPLVAKQSRAAAS